MIIKKHHFISVYIIAILFVFATCKQDDQTRLQAGWTSKDPIAIPFNVRSHEKVLGNLVMNPSFETGRIYYEESSIKSYDINGWKKVGQNIYWVNSNNGDYKINEAYDGIHSVKIIRETADETENIGEGILSDYIKVIPGNYSLKLFLRLENIYPNQARLGTKMYDAINISLQYFDKNKIRIKGEELNAFTNTRIDNSFKAFSLSNYSHIKEFGWGEVYGKTDNYPYFDGDLPDEARYVKIFIGLKGTGTMWVDHVDFRFTDDNFTLLERLKPYFDSSYLPQEMIFPQPKLISKQNTIDYFNVGCSNCPIVIVPKNASKEIIESANKLKNILTRCIASTDSTEAPIIEVKTNLENETSLDQFVISLGNTSIFQENKSALPDSLLEDFKEAYFIHHIKGKENIVFIKANSGNAYFNAAATIQQLFSKSNFKYYATNIVDYPDFNERAVLVNQPGNLKAKKLSLLEQYKLNAIYVNWNENGLKIPVNLISESNLKPGAFVDITENLDVNSFSQYYNNFSSIILNSSDSLDCDEFDINKKCSSDFDLINSIHKDLKKKNLPIELRFNPRWSDLTSIDMGYEDVYFYFYNLNQEIPRNVQLYWSGPAMYSLSVDNAELNRINNIYNRDPAYLDNSLLEKRFTNDFIKQYYAGKIRAKSLFEPYNLRACNNFIQCSDNRKILLNTADFSELEMIRILTASGYFWNSASYCHNKSLWIVLNKLYGRDLTIKLIYYNDAYFGLKEICQKIESEGLLHKNGRIAKSFENSLNKYYSEIENSTLDKNLKNEIALLNESILERYKSLISTLE